MTDADFLSITLNGKLCDAEGGLGEREFELVMRKQVHPSGSCSFAAAQSINRNIAMAWCLQLSSSAAEYREEKANSASDAIRLIPLFGSA
jgi:hypothetical protein